MYRGTDIMKKNTIKNNKGFTIIEVLIVLAIAGLIMLVVLLAVPGLERSQANTAAKTDASHIAAALSDYLANNNDMLPSSNTIGTVYTDVSGLSKLISTALASNSNSSLSSIVGTSPASNTWYFDNVPITTPSINKAEWVVDIDVNASCPTTSVYGSTVTTVSNTSSTSIALLYTTETSGGSDWNCIQAS